MTETSLTRRNFVASAACAAGALGIAANVGTASPAQAEAAQPGGYTAGVYTGVGTGRHGEITVEVTFSDDRLEGIEVVSNSETPDLSDVALTVIPMAIVANQSTDVDVVSGATMTSRGVIAAVEDACEQAGAQYICNAPAEYVAVQGMTPGTYTASAYGKWKEGQIEGFRHGAPNPIMPTEVEVVVDADKIVSVTVLTNSDTPGFCDPALERTPGDIVEQQSIYVDTVTGSTMTSAAITAATMKCLEQAGADLTGFAKATPKVEAEERYEGDIVVIGGGLTGTMAALEAVERGLKPIVIEKTYRVSGTGACSSGPFAVQDQIILGIGNDMTVEQAFVMRMEEDVGGDAHRGTASCAPRLFGAHILQTCQRAMGERRDIERRDGILVKRQVVLQFNFVRGDQAPVCHLPCPYAGTSPLGLVRAAYPEALGPQGDPELVRLGQKQLLKFFRDRIDHGFGISPALSENVLL